MTTENVSAEAPTTFDSVSDAVAELDRRAAVRREAAKETKQEAEPVTEGEDEPLPDEAEEEEAETSEPDDDSDASEEEDVATDEETVVVSLDGKDIEIPKGTPRGLVEQVQTMASELKADYTRKTQEVAAERQRIESAKAQTMAMAQQMQQTQATLQQFMRQTLGEPPSLELAQADPQTYLVQRGMYEQRLHQFQALAAQGQQFQEQSQQELEQQKAEFKHREWQSLLKAMPELSDSTKRQAFAVKAAETGARYGISAQEVENITDHRLILALRDLAKLQEREKSAGNVKQKLANVPPKITKPGTATQDAGKSQRQAEAKRQFMKSGRTDRDLRRWANQVE